jgi:amidase
MELFDMNLIEYTQYDGLGLAKLVRERQIAPKELSQLFIQAVAKVNPQINSVIEVYDDALEIAVQSNPQAPFGGVPFLRKDLGATEAGRLQELGSRLFKGYVPDHDSYLITRFKKAGLVILGRSTVPELGISGQTETILQGITRNPWDLDRMAGGSSGGAAASVAAGIVPVAHASDGGGSIRIPASCCGLVGLNPSRGRISAGPDRQDPMFGLAREFVVSRTVRDTAAMLDAVHGAEAGDPFVIVQPELPYLDELHAPFNKLRIAFTTEAWAPHPVDAEIKAGVEQVASACLEMGHSVEADSPQLDFEKVNTVLMNIFGLSDSGLAKFAESMGRTISLDYLEPGTLKMIERARTLTLAAVMDSFEVMRQARFVVGQFFQKYDLLITPSLSILPQPHGFFSTKRDDLEPHEFWQNDFRIFQHMGLFNVAGTPSVSLPLIQSKSGLPIGVQFAAPFGDEAALIRIAAAFEEAMPWVDRIPPVHVSR